MTAVRLSPAASLLRNSKLFALPPAVALPPQEPSSEPVPGSDTATAKYPTRAAIETPLTSLGRGDWGFKRPLPLKSTTRTGSPTVRLNKGIDTREHIADFDSAADHVLTLKKFQELNQAIRLHNPPVPVGGKRDLHAGVFRKHIDNTTNTSSSAPAFNQYSGVWPNVNPSELQRDMPEDLKTENEDVTTNRINPVVPRKPAKLQRWRYDGPSLAQMSGLEMDRWLKTLDSQKKAAFREVVKGELLLKRTRDHKTKSRDEGTVGEVDSAQIQVTEEEVTTRMKQLRQQPKEFGPLIAAFLDLPHGADGSGLNVDVQRTWVYGRQSSYIFDSSFDETGPPRMHPSAGLSYIHTDRWAPNHAVYGPQEQRRPVVARQVKIRDNAGKNVATVGVSGFIVEWPKHKGTSQQQQTPYTPQSGGQKTTARLGTAEIDVNGALKLTVGAATEYLVEGTKAVHNSMVKDPRVAALRPGKGSRVAPKLARGPAAPVTYKKRDDLASEDQADELSEFLNRTG